MGGPHGAETAHPKNAILKVREGERTLGAGCDPAEVLRHLGLVSSVRSLQAGRAALQRDLGDW